MTPVRLALVGYGAWGRNYLKAARDSGEAEVTQIVLRPRSRSRGEAERTGLPVMHDVSDIDADAAVIAVHPRAAPFIARVMMEVCGLPVMIEKPAALCLADAEMLRAGEAESGRLVLVAHQHLFAERVEAMHARGVAYHAMANFTGPVERDYPARWDYGSHAVACLLAAGVLPGPSGSFRACVSPDRTALVAVNHGNDLLTYDGYAPAEPALTRAVRAFAGAVRAGGTDDWRFGARWAVDVARILETATPISSS